MYILDIFILCREILIYEPILLKIMPKRHFCFTCTQNRSFIGRVISEIHSGMNFFMTYTPTPYTYARPPDIFPVSLILTFHIITFCILKSKCLFFHRKKTFLTKKQNWMILFRLTIRSSNVVFLNSQPPTEQNTGVMCLLFSMSPLLLLVSKTRQFFDLLVWVIRDRTVERSLEQPIRDNAMIYGSFLRISPFYVVWSSRRNSQISQPSRFHGQRSHVYGWESRGRRDTARFLYYREIENFFRPHRRCVINVS